MTGYLHRFITKMTSESQKNRVAQLIHITNELHQNLKKHSFLLPTSKIKLHRTLPEKLQTEIVHKAIKLGSKFKIQDFIPLA